MEFGSKYVYAYSDSEEESISDEEYEAGIEQTSSVAQSQPIAENSDAANAVSGRSFKKSKKLFSFMKKSASKDEKGDKARDAPHSTSEGPEGQAGNRRVQFCGAGKKWRRADTNVIAVKFNEALVAPQGMHTGDPIVCSGCQGMMSHISKVIECTAIGGDGLKKWKCEFCGVTNEVDLTSDEIPSQSDVTYMIEPAPCTTGAGRSGADESLVVFCVDTSGSMCVSQEVPGRVNLRGNHTDRYSSLNTENANQWLPGQRRNVAYITRLQALQAAVDHQLEQLCKDHPTRRAALVTFSSEVTVIGDGRSTAVTVAGDKLSEWDTLVSIGGQLSLPVSVKDSRQSLGQKVFDLEEDGQTALGPAMLVSVAMACQVPGSKVIMCTDGMANIGIGNLDIANPVAAPEGSGEALDDEYSRSIQFYRKVAELANANGVSVSVITIAGTECRLVELGGVANETGGQVNIVDPLKLTEEFGNILADPVIASRVVATFLVHKRLYIRGEAERINRVVKEVGNVTKKSEITFEYGVISKKAFKRNQQQQQESQASGSAAAATASELASAAEVVQMEIEATTATAVNSESADSAAAVKAETNQAATGSDTAAAASDICIASAAEVTALTTGAAASDTAEGDDEDLTELPFQVQIKYTDLDGAQAMRVITQTKPVTRDRGQAETYVNFPVIGCHAAKASSNLAQQGAYTPSRLNAFTYQRLFTRNSTSGVQYLDRYNDLMAPLDQQLLQVQRVEASERGGSVSHYDDNDEDILPRAASASSALVLKKSAKPGQLALVQQAAAARRMRCSDLTAAAMYNNSSVSSENFKKPEKPDKPDKTDKPE